jgi:K+-transporting ATPase A subunit
MASSGVWEHTRISACSKRGSSMPGMAISRRPGQELGRRIDLPRVVVQVLVVLVVPELVVVFEVAHADLCAAAPPSLASGSVGARV